MIFESRMKNSHGPSVQCCEFVAQQALLLPNDLEEMLRRKACALLSQGAARKGAATGAPARIKVGGIAGHWPQAFAEEVPPCQAQANAKGLRENPEFLLAQRPTLALDLKLQADE
jgi:hypothetical protein